MWIAIYYTIYYQLYYISLSGEGKHILVKETGSLSGFDHEVMSMTMMPRTTCSMCVCVCASNLSCSTAFLHISWAARICWWSLCTPHHQDVGPGCLPQHHAEALHNLSESQRSTKTEKVYESTYVHERPWKYRIMEAMVQFYFRRIQLHFLCIQLRVWLRSRAQHQRLNWERPMELTKGTRSDLEPSGLQDCISYTHAKVTAVWTGTAYGTIFCQDVNGILGLWTTTIQLKLNLKDIQWNRKVLHKTGLLHNRSRPDQADLHGSGEERQIAYIFLYVGMQSAACIVEFHEEEIQERLL